MPHITSNAANAEQLRKEYEQFMEEKNAKARFYNSLQEFMKSDVFKALPPEEQEEVQEQAKDGVVHRVMVFDSWEQAEEFVENMVKKGLMSQDLLDKIHEKADEERQENSYRPGF